MKDRIRMIMEGQHMSQKDFAQFTGISEGSLSGIFNGRTRPTLQVVESIHEKLPSVSVDWLMFGTGPMYVQKSKDATSGQDVQEQSIDPTVFGSARVAAPTIFDATDQAQLLRADSTPNNTPQTIVKYVDKPARKITEIRIFFDDQTWETFEPKR